MIENNLRSQLSPHSNRSYETSSRKIRDLKIRRWQQQRLTSKKKNNHTSWPRSQGSGHFWNRIICYPDWYGQRPKPLWNEVSSGCCFGEQFHWFRVKADSFRKYVVSKISGLEWTWPYNQKNNSARTSCFFVRYFCRQCTRGDYDVLLKCLISRFSAESDVTRRRDNNLQRRFSVGHSITTLLQPCLK